MKKHILAPQAIDDLIQILDYIAKDSAGAASRVIQEIEDAVAQLADQPGLGHVREDLADDSVRFWSVYDWLIIYDPNTKPMEVLRVLRGQRDVKRILEKE